MSVTQINLTGLIRQPESNYQMDQKTGGFKGTVVYRCVWNQALSLAPKKNDPHPDSPTLLCTDTKITQEDGEIAKIESTYEGLAPTHPSGGGTDELPAPEYELNTSTSQEPIETNFAFSSVTAEQRDTIEKVLKGELDKTVLDSFPANAWNLYILKLNGITSFYVPSMTYTKSYASYSRPDSAIEKVGKIDKPSGAPTLPQGRNWLRLGTTWRRAGGYYQINESWMASGEGGWDSFIYGDLKDRKT